MTEFEKVNLSSILYHYDKLIGDRHIVDYLTDCGFDINLLYNDVEEMRSLVHHKEKPHRRRLRKNTPSYKLYEHIKPILVLVDRNEKLKKI